MTQAEVVKELAAKVKIPANLVRAMFSEFMQLAVAECRANGKCRIPGIGYAVKRDRQARVGRNPRTGEAINIPAKTIVKLRPSAQLKEALL